MIRRCYKPDTKQYQNYGGRGIKVCDEWKCSIEAFVKWSLENGYERNLTIDRADNNLGYSPSNCRWVCKSVQSNNKRSNKCLEYNGKVKSMADWCRYLGLSYYKVRSRLRYGWSVERAFETE